MKLKKGVKKQNGRYDWHPYHIRSLELSIVPWKTSHDLPSYKAKSFVYSLFDISKVCGQCGRQMVTIQWRTSPYPDNSRSLRSFVQQSAAVSFLGLVDAALQHSGRNCILLSSNARVTSPYCSLWVGLSGCHIAFQRTYPVINRYLQHVWLTVFHLD